MTKKRSYNLIDIGKKTIDVFRDTEGNIYSGYATLYILMALIPIVILLAGAINLLPETYLKQFAEIFVSLFPNIPQIRDLINGLLENINPQAGTIVVSVSVLTCLWSASNGTKALRLGLRKISGDGSPLIKTRLIALVYTVLFVILIPMLLIFRVLRGSLEELAIKLAEMIELPDVTAVAVDVLEKSGLITLAAMAFMIVLTYTFLQGHRKKLRTQLPGAIFTTLLWVLFSWVFEMFIKNFWRASSLYGPLASIFLTALWMKTIITILFLGAALNEALFRLREESAAAQTAQEPPPELEEQSGLPEQVPEPENRPGVQTGES